MNNLQRLLRFVKPYWSPLIMSVILMAIAGTAHSAMAVLVASRSVANRRSVLPVRTVATRLHARASHLAMKRSLPVTAPRSIAMATIAGATLSSRVAMPLTGRPPIAMREVSRRASQARVRSRVLAASHSARAAADSVADHLLRQ